MGDPVQPLAIVWPETNEFKARRNTNWDAPKYARFIDEELTLTCGRDTYGDPLMRIVWGQKLTRISNGDVVMQHPIQQFIINGSTYQIGIPRFIVQQKMPAEEVGLETWDENLQGPKPYRGLYIFLACIQTPTGEFRLPDVDFLLQLKHLEYNKRQAIAYQKSPEATKWKSMALQADVEHTQMIIDRKRRADVRHFFNERMRRIKSEHPNEGRALDPYRESKKQKTFGNIIF